MGMLMVSALAQAYAGALGAEPSSVSRVKGSGGKAFVFWMEQGNWPHCVANSTSLTIIGRGSIAGCTAHISTRLGPQSRSEHTSFTTQVSLVEFVSV